MVMKNLYNVLLVSVLGLTVACKKSPVNETQEDFENPKTLEAREESPMQTSNFNSLVSSESLSNEMFIPDRIGFAFDSAEISKSQKEILDAQIAFIKQNESFVKKVVVSGYCDERGSIEYNYALGERRANAVKKYLVKNGLQSSMISTVSYGKEVVLVEGSSEEAYSQNRVGKVTLCESIL